MATKWIYPVDKLPENGMDVLVTIKPNSDVDHHQATTTGYEVYPAEYVDNNGMEIDDEWYPHFLSWDGGDIWTKEVVAWMPFPEPCEEEKYAK